MQGWGKQEFPKKPVVQLQQPHIPHVKIQVTLVGTEARLALWETCSLNATPPQPQNPAITLAPKKKGTWRFCVDFRQLNQVTCSALLPYRNVKDKLSLLAQAIILTSLDFKNGYWQAPVKLEDRKKTAFIAPGGR
ncbi:hypothetical protein PR048_012496 [Dryococelus australis]|uniref:Reverse transcriptase domain-containing protein n=1 Tax=Dryococelus australis TaxID=614101 RepID=A0ABQ9HPN0_9NEOP|nr:hypothetical protein PR048_012496 [Dryococelus australis]